MYNLLLVTLNCIHSMRIIQSVSLEPPENMNVKKNQKLKNIKMFQYLPQSRDVGLGPLPCDRELDLPLLSDLTATNPELYN